MEVVWLERDLRIRDHAPLLEAAKRGPVLVLYVYEPELLAAPEHDPAHFAFVDGSLRELDAALRARGGRLTTRVGRLPDMFEVLHREAPFERLWSHEGTGTALTYARDRRVRRWCRERGVAWHEIPQHGVFRPLPSRDGWSAAWERRMRPPPRPAPDGIDPAAGVAHEGRRTPTELGVGPSTRPGAQAPGEHAAWETLRSFLQERGRDYRTDMSSPVTAWDGCSRLSAHLAYGTMSMRSVHHATGVRLARLQAEGARTGKHARRPPDRFRASLEAFASRLRWHCHFIQKLESAPRIEHENVNRAFDGMREGDFDEAAFDAWREGRTGYPLVDACMRALAETGWINFRMRAMLVSFATHHLWLHWRQPALHLARAFLDFEPGIHFSQMQMQAGTTGINALRVYNPIKQQHDQDPRGIFVRRWLPALAGVPDSVMVELTSVDLLIIDDFALEPMSRDESRDDLVIEGESYRPRLKPTLHRRARPPNLPACVRPRAIPPRVPVDLSSSWGGGPGGLAAALAPHRVGWSVRLLERAPGIRADGAGLTVSGSRLSRSAWRPAPLRGSREAPLSERMRVSAPEPAESGGSRDSHEVRCDCSSRVFSSWRTTSTYSGPSAGW